MKIFLLGFMGSGKTYLAQLLAETLDLPYLDLDAYIEEKTGQSIPALFEKEGEEQFRKIEAQSLQEVIKEQSAFVMACGGGTPCFHGNIQLMNLNGISVFLDTSEALIFERIKATSDERPLLQGLEGEALRQFIRQKRAARLEHYEEAHLSFEIQADEGYNELIDYFKKFKVE